MIFTLQRYIFRELFRVFIMATVALTGILSVGSILRPVQEYGIGPGQVIHLIGYFLPIMLTFVLPIAALFASSLVYGRFASDNEINACRASGISFMTLVYPGIVLAVIVAIANLLLSFHVMPDFVKRAEKAFKDDASAILFRNIQRKGYYNLDKGFIVLADKADPQNQLLSGVIVTGMKNGKIDDITTAEKARIKFFNSKNENEVHILAENTMRWSGQGKEGLFTQRGRIVKKFPPLMTDSVKFKKIDEMKQIYEDPMQFSPVRKIAYQAYSYFTAKLLSEHISEKFENEKPCRLTTDTGHIEFTAENCEISDSEKLELTGNVQITQFDPAGKTIQVMECQNAALHIEGDPHSPTLMLILNNAKWTRADGSEGFGQRPLRGLLMPQQVEKYLIEDVPKALSPQYTKNALASGPDSTLINLQNTLQHEIEDTKRDILAEKHSRLVFGVGCLPLIMIGIGLGVIKKGGHLLSAFGVSSVPAAILVIFIMAGKQLTKNQVAGAENYGVILMWAGVGLLFLLSMIVYRKLLKN